MRLTRTILVVGFGLVSMVGNANAVNIVIDYSYDTTNFFGAGNPDGALAGQQARDAIEAAADYFSDITNDTFSGISTPAPFYSQVFSGQVTWEWTLNFSHPATGANVVLTDQTIQPDEYLIYVGARNLSGTTLGRGGPGGWGWSSNPSGGFTSGEIDEIDQITDAFADAVENRGETGGFANWGGAITFDTPNDWHFDHTTNPGGIDSDFYSVAIHEMAHALGLGASSEWNALVSGTYFTGAAATSAYGSNPPLNPGLDHWAEGTMSTVYGGLAAQEAAMDPTITDGTRKLFTTLDAAALTDIGWDLTPPVSQITGDLDGDGFVGIADLNIVLGNWNLNVSAGVWLDGDPSGDGFVGIEDLNAVLGNWNAGTPPTASAVPEPASAMLLGLAGAGLIGRKQRH
ncbi:MAG: matrixin family metalloprotease [Phycisphaerales bacterium]